MRRTDPVLALFLFAIAACQSGPTSTAHSEHDSALQANRAWLGAGMRIPSAAEAEAMELPTDVRLQGRAIDSVLPNSPAALAGLKVGDVLMSLDENALYSDDDFIDFLNASDPGDEVKLTIRRAGNAEDELLLVELSGSPDQHASDPSIDWEFASLAQLTEGQAKAKNEGRRLLIGLSGAET